MGGFADKHRQKEHETKEAVEKKATEYAELTKEVEKLKTSNENLEKEVAELKGTISNLTEALRGITLESIENVKKSGEKIFEPLKQTATELNKKIMAAGEEATKRVRNAGEKSLAEYLLQGAVTAVWYAVITAAVMWWGLGFDKIKAKVNYTANKASVIHYNQTTGQEYGTYDPWHMEEYSDKWHEIDKQLDKAGQKNAQQNSN